MSLQVWFPLTGHLENQGIADVTVVNNGSASNTNGKLGMSYSFPNNASVIISGYSNFGNNFSIALWFYCTNISNAKGILCNRSATYGGITIYLQGGVLTIDPCADNYSASTRWTTNFTATTSVWYHLVVTRSPTEISYYINGEFQESRTVAFSNSFGNCFSLGAFQANGTNIITYFYGRLNDVRVYDEVLSVKQIKLLAQGLVCHYQLNTEWGLANLLKTTPKSYTPTAYCGYQAEMSENMVRGDTYTIQLWDVDISHTGKTADQLGIWVYWGGGSISLFNWHGTSYFTNGHADYLCYTFTAPNATHSTTDNAWLNIYNSTPQADGTRNMHIGRWKLEKGSVATPWQPNSLDTEYDTMGWGDNIIYDSSGYNNHMQKVGDIITATNTARNTISTYFKNGQYGISFYNSNSGYLPTDALTVNLWMYCTTWGNPISCTEGGGFNFENSTNGLQFPLYVSGIGYKTPNSGVAVSTLLNAWHMLTGTFDRTNVKIYIDGELKATTATGSTNGVKYAAARLCLAAEAKNTAPQSSTFVGSLSDVRIYATALSDEDIMALYNTPTSVTNLGTMVTQGEFVEK